MSAGDPEIERLEDELRQSQFTKWDAESFLVERHQAKIDALTKPENKWDSLVLFGRELGLLLLAALGFITLMTALGLCLLTGSFSILT